MGWGFWAFPFAMLLLAWTFVRNPREHFGLRVTAALLIAPLFGTIVHLMVCRVGVHGADVRRDHRPAL